MNMDLYDTVVIDHNNAVADAFKVRTELCGVVAALFLVDDIFGAVSELDIRLVCTCGILAHKSDLALFFCSLSVLDDAVALDNAVDALEYEEKSHSA